MDTIVFSYLHKLQFNFQKVGVIGKLIGYSFTCCCKNLKIVKSRHKVPFVVAGHNYYPLNIS